MATPWGCEESDTTEQLHFHFSLSCVGEGNGNPLQCSCLENPRVGGAWWASVYGVAQSRTQLKRLSSSSSSSIPGEGNGNPSSVHAWKISWTEEPGRLQSMGSRRVGYDWETSLHFSCIAGRFFTVCTTRETLICEFKDVENLLLQKVDRE